MSTPAPDDPNADQPPEADSPATRAARIQAIADAARGKATPGPDAARSQDFLYDDNGLPG